MATTPTPASEVQGPISTFGRLTGALLEPQATFEDIARRPSWIAPIVLLTLISLGITAIFSQRVGWERFMVKQFEQNPRTAQMTPEQRQQALERAVPITRAIGYVSGALGQLIFALVLAGIFLGVFNIAGAGLRFLASLGIVSYALLPAAIKGLLGVVVLYLKDPDTVDLRNLVASNLGAFVSNDAPKWLATLANSIDLFNFWIILLLAIGFSAANPKKLSVARALGIVFGLYALVVLIRVGWAAAFS